MKFHWLNTAETMMNRLKIDPDYANPRAALGPIGTLGELGGRRVTLGTMRAFNAIDDKASFSPTGIVDFLISATVETPDGTKLTEQAVQGLEPADRAQIVSTLINLHDNWFDKSADATGIGPRCGGESDEEYLARGFQATNEDFLASSKRIADSIKRSTAGLGDAWKIKLLPGLTANTAASDRVGSIISSMARAPLLGDRQTYEPREIPEVPPHPAHRTNALLEDLADRIGDMQLLALATGEMQQSLNDTARAVVEKFSEGAEASSKATEDGDLPPAEWPRDYDSLDHERGIECRARSTSRKRSSASWVKLRLCQRREPRLPRHAGGSRSESRPIIGGARNMAG